MARVAAIVVGGSEKFLDAETVKEVKEQLSAATYTATVNGDPADNDQELRDNDFVSLAPSVKGA